MGIVVVARLAARVISVPELTMQSTLSRTSLSRERGSEGFLRP